MFFRINKIFVVPWQLWNQSVFILLVPGLLFWLYPCVKALLTEERCFWIQLKATFHLTQVNNMYIGQDKLKKKSLCSTLCPRKYFHHGRTARRKPSFESVSIQWRNQWVICWSKNVPNEIEQRILLILPLTPRLSCNAGTNLKQRLFKPDRIVLNKTNRQRWGYLFE